MAASEEQALAFIGALEVDNTPDFVIKIEDYQWSVHSQLFSNQSRFFEVVFNSPFKELAEKEVVLHDDCPWIVARMIQFIYFGDYDGYEVHVDGTGTGRSGKIGHYATENLWKMMKVGGFTGRSQQLREYDEERSWKEISALLYQIADKYDIPTLRNKAAIDLEGASYDDEEDLFTIIDIIGLDALHSDLALLRSMVENFCDNFAANPLEFPRFRTLLGSDLEFTMAVFEHMQQKINSMQRIVSESSARALELEQVRSELDLKTIELAAEKTKARYRRGRGGRSCAEHYRSSP